MCTLRTLGRTLPAAVAILALSHALAAPASAQTPQVKPSPQAPEALPPETEAFHLTPFVGLGFAGNLENTPGTFGAALGYGWTPRVTVEGDFFVAPGGEQGVIEAFDTNVWSLSANVLYHFIRESSRPTSPRASAC